MKPLVIIPARGGSKGIPGKNIKPLAGKPLIYYAIDAARQVAPDSRICLTTDSDEIIAAAEAYGLPVPFKRPAYLSTDKAGTYEVLLHALDHYTSRGVDVDTVILLQPTSPFRTGQHVAEALELFEPGIDMVVSVKEADCNPYYNCFEEDADGNLRISKGPGSYTRRQDCPKAYQYNGAVYIINPDSLHQMPLGAFPRKRKYVMDTLHSLDLDTPLDWAIAEAILAKDIL